MLQQLLGAHLARLSVYTPKEKEAGTLEMRRSVFLVRHRRLPVGTLSGHGRQVQPSDRSRIPTWMDLG